MIHAYRSKSFSPRDPKIDKWLRSIEPRQELAVRYAMRERFPEICADRVFTARIDELRAALNPDETQLAMILADARAIAGKLDELLDDGKPPPRRR